MFSTLEANLQQRSVEASVNCAASLAVCVGASGLRVLDRQRRLRTVDRCALVVATGKKGV